MQDPRTSEPGSPVAPEGTAVSRGGSEAVARKLHLEPSFDAPMESSVALTPTPTSSYAARNFVAGTLRRCNREDLVEVAILLTSEVVTNVIRHARTNLIVTVRVDRERARVTVRDEEIRPPIRRQRGAEGGHGLTLVDALAGSWGTTPYREGKAVWFDL